ncbi:MAG: HupE/UreJ family protein [Phycisphaerae bacterium]
MRTIQLLIVLGLTAVAHAHDFTITQTTALLKADGTFVIDMKLDVDALALGVPSSTPEEQMVPLLRTMSPEIQEKMRQQAINTLLRRLRVRFDNEKADFAVSFPPAPQRPDEPPTFFGTVARLSGAIPADAQSFSFSGSRGLPDIELTIFEEATGRGVKHSLTAGEDSPDFVFGELPVEDHGAVFGRYLFLGFEHIIPKGLDHILFVLGLFLLSARLRPLLWQITAFTLAHTLTLALSMTGVVSVSPNIVEPLIALSIVYVAVENIFTRELKWWRPAIVFAFGLLHGLGFAGVLSELGMSAGRYPTALAGFNIGVELGQLTVVFAALLLVGWFRNKSWYRKVITIPLSIAIALLAAFWVLERTNLVQIPTALS